MKTSPRPGYGLFQLLVVLAIIVLLIGILLPAVQKVRSASARMQSSNNLRQLVTAVQNYDSSYSKLPRGIDDRNFSVLYHLLPFIGQIDLFKSIDKTFDSDDKANAEFRATTVKMFLSPLDPINGTAPAGGTNYFAMAGSKMSIHDNDGMFCGDNKLTLVNIPDGTTYTVFLVELPRGDGGKKAVSVQRQHVRLKVADLATLKAGDGVKDFADDKNIVADRGSAWIDGRFLRAMTNGTRGAFDPKPDVDCGGEGGLAGVRAAGPTSLVVMGDCSVRSISPALSFAPWQNACNASDGNVLGADW